MSGVPVSIVAGCCALTAFCVALVAGISAGNDASSILIRAFFAMAACYGLGLAVGAACRWGLTSRAPEIVSGVESAISPQTPGTLASAARHVQTTDSDKAPDPEAALPA